MQPTQRERMLSRVRVILFDLPGLARIGIKDRHRVGWRARFPWPGNDPLGLREKIWAQIERELNDLQREGEIVITPEGWRPKECYRLDWPEGENLFSATDPPPEPEARQQRTSATGALVVFGLADPRENEDCERDVLRLLYAEQRRLVLDDLVDALADSKECYSWGRTRVAQAVKRLQNREAVDNGSDQRGRGYGLRQWETNPLSEE